MSKHIETIARGVCVSGDKILLCHTEGAENTYLPGGHVEFGESARESLAREIKEELALDSTVGRFLGMVEHAFIQKEKAHFEINMVFLFNAPELPIEQSPESAEGHIDFRWVSLSELDEVRLEPAPLRTLLPKWLAEADGVDRFASTFE